MTAKSLNHDTALVRTDASSKLAPTTPEWADEDAASGAAFRSRYRNLYGPDWRWKLAQAQTELNTENHLADDSAFQQAFRFINFSRENKNKKPSARSFGAIKGAIRISKSLSVETLKVMVLAGKSSSEMHHLAAIPAAEIELWESLFFDVREVRHSKLWLTDHVVRAELKAGNAKLASRFQLVLSGEPQAIELAISSGQHTVTSDQERQFCQDLVLHSKFDAMMAHLGVSETSALTFLKTYLDHTVKLQRLDVEREKIAATREASERRYVLELLRLQQEARPRTQASNLASLTWRSEKTASPPTRSLEVDADE